MIVINYVISITKTMIMHCLDTCSCDSLYMQIQLLCPVKNIIRK